MNTQALAQAGRTPAEKVLHLFAIVVLITLTLLLACALLGFFVTASYASTFLHAFIGAIVAFVVFVDGQAALALVFLLITYQVLQTVEDVVAGRVSSNDDEIAAYVLGFTTTLLWHAAFAYFGTGQFGELRYKRLD